MIVKWLNKPLRSLGNVSSHWNRGHEDDAVTREVLRRQTDRWKQDKRFYVQDV